MKTDSIRLNLVQISNMGHNLKTLALHETTTRFELARQLERIQLLAEEALSKLK